MAHNLVNLFIPLNIFCWFCAFGWEFDIISITETHQLGGLIPSIKPRRIGNGEYGMNGTMKVNVDLDNSNYVEAKIYHSPLGNNQYSLTPFRVLPTYLYDFMNKYYKLISEDVKNYTDFPAIYNAPIPKGNYYIKTVKIDKSKLPKYIPSGVYKMVCIAKGPEVDVEVKFITKVTSLE